MASCQIMNSILVIPGTAMTNPNLYDNFAVRTSRRQYENAGKVCPGCGEIDPLLIEKDGLCANCARPHKVEKHHLLGKAFRVSKEDREMIIPVSPNAHRLLSDLHADHPAADDPASPDFPKSQIIESLLSLYELWLVLTYLTENHDKVHGFAVSTRTCSTVLVLILLVLLVLNGSAPLDLSKMPGVLSRKRRDLRPGARLIFYEKSTS